MSLAVLVTMGLVPAVARSAVAAPRPKPASSVSPAKPSGRSAPATVAADARAAVSRGGAEVLVSYDPTGAITKARAQTHRGSSRAQRAAATRAAAAAYAVTKRAAMAHAGAGVTTKRDYDHLPIQLVHVDSLKALDVLAASPGVRSIQLPQLRRIDAVPTNLSLIKQPEAAAAGYTGNGVTVAIADTGVDWNLPGVDEAFGDCSAGVGTGTCRIANFSTTVTRAPDETICTDEFNNDPDVDHHGTNVSGIVAEVAPAAKLDVYRVFKIVNCDTGEVRANDSDIITALNSVAINAAAHNTRSVNLSLGNGGYHNSECGGSTYSAAFMSLRALGVIPVVAAGNAAFQSGTFHAGGGIADPACASGALSVGAVYSANLPGSWPGDGLVWQGGCSDTDPRVDTIACFSQTSQILGLLAPGLLVTAAGVRESGTSQAAPHVAGAVADLISANPRATGQQVVRALTSTGPLITDPRDPSIVKHRLDILAAAEAVKAPLAEIEDPACTATSVPANDDGSSPGVALPFVANFFGTSYSQAYVNNNGNLTFQGPQSTYTPFTIDASVPPIIAPFFADVDTRGPGSGLVTYGTTTYGSRSALCVNWNGVGYYAAHTDKLNSFQLLLVDRGDVGAGDFDVVMNYDALNWETGDASGGANGLGGTAAGAGYSAGDGDPDHFFQFPGSLTPNGLLDTNGSVPNTALVNGSRGSLLSGRYIFPVRNGAPPGAATLTGFVRDQTGQPQSGSPVQACPIPSGSCVVGFTASDGHYTIVGLAAGSYRLTAFPPAGSSAMSAQAGPVMLDTGSRVAVDLVLTAPQGPPAGTTITSHGSTADGIPVLYWTDPISLDTAACSGATATYVIVLNGSTVRSGTLTETPEGSGQFHAAVDAFYPLHGNATVTITVTCPGRAPTQNTFNIYIDPSGTVVNTLGDPVAGATVTLLRSESAGGPFAAVPDGSAIMSPSARSNPETTGPDGTFHWDVLAGFYRVQASKPGCVVPGTHDPSATSATYEVPPPALGITLVLDCGENATTSATTLSADPATAVVDQPVLLTATITGTGSLPTGTVTFSAADGSVTGCDARPVDTGQATCSVTFAHATQTPIEITANYSGDATHPASTGHLALTVAPATPVITWATPGDITYPAPLTATQLNATANVPGTFTYTLPTGGPALGAVLHAGTGQLLDVMFTHANGADYTTASAQVAINVLPGAQAISVDPVPAVVLGTPTATITAHGGGSGLPVTFVSASPATCVVATTSGTAPTLATVNILATGTCSLLASQAGTADWAPAPEVTVTFPIVPASTTPSTDVRVSADRKTQGGKLTSPALTTHGSGELILAFVSADGPRSSGAQRVRSVTGGGLAWTMAARSTTGYGTTEVWQAYAIDKLTNAKVVAKLRQHGYRGSITVAAFTGAAERVAASASATGRTGAATVRLTPSTSRSLIWATGHNWNSITAVTLPATQSLVHQYVDRRAEDVYWAQSTNDPTSGTPVDVNVITPNVGGWQLTAVEIAPMA